MIFLTVGTYPLQFDRLVQAVDIAVQKKLIKEKVFAQIGFCRYKPQHMEYVEMLEKSRFDSCLQEACGIIGHAGMGTITMALDHDKPLLVMPRIKRFHEHVNDHQLATAKKFEQLGHVLVAYEPEDLLEKIDQVGTFVPRQRERQPGAVANRIGDFLRQLIDNSG